MGKDYVKKRKITRGVNRGITQFLQVSTNFELCIFKKTFTWQNEPWYIPFVLTMFISCSGLIRSWLAPINPQQHRPQLKSHIGFPAICCTNSQNFNSVPITARVSCKGWGTFCMPAAAKHIYNWLLFEREKFFSPSSFTLSLAIWGERIHHTFCCLYPSHKAGFHGHWKPRKSGNFLLRGNTTLNCEASTNEMKPRLEILKKCLADIGPCTAFEH